VTLAARLREVLGAHPEVECAVLFGSQARGTAGPRSDVDVAVRLIGGGRPRRELANDLERAAGRTLDLLDLDAAPPLARFEIARDGVVLVERRPFAWADFRARAMLDWWDFAPLARRMWAGPISRLQERAARGPA
jgi:predicted nucleotidyltransferase